MTFNYSLQEYSNKTLLN